MNYAQLADLTAYADESIAFSIWDDRTHIRLLIAEYVRRATDTIGPNAPHGSAYTDLQQALGRANQAKVIVVTIRQFLDIARQTLTRVDAVHTDLLPDLPETFREASASVQFNRAHDMAKYGAT